MKSVKIHLDGINVKCGGTFSSCPFLKKYPGTPKAPSVVVEALYYKPEGRGFET
jgi:hypothetical protein